MQYDVCTPFLWGTGAYAELSDALTCAALVLSSLRAVAESRESLIKCIKLELTWQDIC